MGDFATIDEATNKAAKNVVNKVGNFAFVFTAANLDNGIIFNSVIQNSVYQIMLYRGNLSKRTITSSATTEFEKITTGGFKQGLSVLGPKIFKLTTESSPEDIKAALTDTITSKLIKESDLDECIVYGKTIKDAITNGTVQIGWSGQGFIFVEVGLQNPTKPPYISYIIIKVSDKDGTYQVLKNGESKEIATIDKITALEARIEALESSLKA